MSLSLVLALPVNHPRSINEQSTNKHVLYHVFHLFTGNECTDISESSLNPLSRPTSLTPRSVVRGEVVDVPGRWRVKVHQ